MLQKIVDNIKIHNTNNAFCIQGRFYTYHEFACYISAIRKILSEKVSKKQEIIGVISADNIETYAAIIAIWLEGHTYLPVNPNNPYKRNLSILNQSECKTILFSDTKADQYLTNNSFLSVDIKNVQDNNINLEFKKPGSEDIMYIIFTSGSTGIPKGVPISYKNLSSFIIDFVNAGYSLTNEDRFLQIYDLSFDASVHCYTLPLYIGGCIFTVPQQEIKYMYAYKLLDKYNITFAKMPPSTITYLRPFFDRIRLPHLRYCLFGGEAFYTSLVEHWRQCVPNAEIHNVYGPTEVTVNCTIFPFPELPADEDIYQGVASIGKTFGSNHAVILDKTNNILAPGMKGELCFAGNQVTRGYIGNSQKNIESFVNLKINGATKCFYKTGDLAFINNNGNIVFCGRIDNQVQIDGYRIETGEIENIAMEFTKGNVAAIPKTTDGQTFIVLFTENFNNHNGLLSYLQNNLPGYMVPRKIINKSEFPKSAGGKINKKALLDLLYT